MLRDRGNPSRWRVAESCGASRQYMRADAGKVQFVKPPAKGGTLAQTFEVAVMQIENAKARWNTSLVSVNLRRFASDLHRRPYAFHTGIITQTDHSLLVV